MLRIENVPEPDLASDSIIFGPPPLWDGEDAAKYNNFRTQVSPTSNQVISWSGF